jgi:hypothetical protein
MKTRGTARCLVLIGGHNGVFISFILLWAHSCFLTRAVFPCDISFQTGFFLVFTM